MKRAGVKFKIGIVLIIIEAVAYVSSLMGYGDGNGIPYIYAFANGDFMGGILDFVGFNLIGIIGVVLVLISGRKDEKTK